MKTAIIFASKHGTCAKVVQMLSEQIGLQNLSSFSLEEKGIIDISPYSQVVIGGSIHAGKIQSRISEFCKKNQTSLLTKKLGLFICCMYEGETAISQLNNAFPDELLEHSSCSLIMGGEFLFEKMNFFERLMVKKVAGVYKSQSRISMANIMEMSRIMSE